MGVMGAGGGRGESFGKAAACLSRVGWGQSQPYRHIVVKSKADHLGLKPTPGLKCQSHILSTLCHSFLIYKWYSNISLD